MPGWLLPHPLRHLPLSREQVTRLPADGLLKLGAEAVKGLMAKPQAMGRKTTPCTGTLLLPKPSYVWVQGYLRQDHEAGQRVVASPKA